MIRGRSLSRSGVAGAFAALLLSAGFAFASIAHAATPMFLYGPAEGADSHVVVFVDGDECATADVDVEESSATGFLWHVELEAGECGAARSSLISFTLAGEDAGETLGWEAFGLPENLAVGIILTVEGNRTEEDPTVPVLVVPPPGETAINAWNGGSVLDISELAAAQGCIATSVTANSAVGAGLVVFGYGGPDLVNSSFLVSYPGGELPQVAIILRCG